MDNLVIFHVCNLNAGAHNDNYYALLVYVCIRLYGSAFYVCTEVNCQ